MFSLSKRSNLAGYRAGFVTGDPALMKELLLVGRQAGMIVPGPVQAAMIAALSDDAHAAEQKARYAARRAILADGLTAAGFRIEHSEAGLYLWATRPGLDCWAACELLATECGILVGPGSMYGPEGNALHPRRAHRDRRAGRRRRRAPARFLRPLTGERARRHPAALVRKASCCAGAGGAASRGPLAAQRIDCSAASKRNGSPDRSMITIC